MEFKQEPIGKKTRIEVKLTWWRPISPKGLKNWTKKNRDTVSRQMVVGKHIYFLYNTRDGKHKPVVKVSRISNEEKLKAFFKRYCYKEGLWTFSGGSYTSKNKFKRKWVRRAEAEIIITKDGKKSVILSKYWLMRRYWFWEEN